MIYNLPRKKAKFEETWVIKQFPELMYGSITMEIPFESNSTNFQKLKCVETFFLVPVYIMTQLMFGTPTVVNEAYRTITFFEPPTGDLLTWLQANAVKQ